MFDRFTKQATRCFQRARIHALAAGRDRIDADSLLCAILADAECVGSSLFRHLGAAPTAGVPIAFGDGSDLGGDTRRLEFSDATKRSLESSLAFAQRLGHDHIGTGHLLLGISTCGDPGIDALRRRVETCEDVDAALATVMGKWKRFPDERGPWWMRVRARLGLTNDAASAHAAR